jgi:HEAT repeat protein
MSHPTAEFFELTSLHMSEQEILDLLKEPVEYVQFTLRDHAPMKALVRAMRKTSDAWARGTLVSVINMRYKAARSAVPALILYLDDPDPRVRCAAADVLGKIRHPVAGPALAERWPTETDNAVRGMYAAAIGSTGYRKAISVLDDALDDPDPGVRQGSAWALGELRLASRSQALQRRRLEEPDDYVKQTISDALRKIAASSSTSDSFGSEAKC